MHTLFLSRIRLMLTLLGLWIFSGFLVAQAVSVQPRPFLSPLQVPGAFLSVPYYGVHAITAYVDHDPLGAPYGQYNDRISLFDGRTANRDNGFCGTDANGRSIAYYTQPYSQGQCIWYDSHDGNDFSLDYEPVLAAADGTVIQAGWDNWNDRYAGYGLHLFISHANGYETRYGHLSALAIVTNATVYRGQIIGTSGNTGNSSGAHLHFEVRLNGTATDPFGGAGAQWLWLDGSWDAQSRWVGQTTPQYSAPFDVDDDNPQQVGDPNDDPNFTKGCQGGYAPPNNCPYWNRATGVGINDDMLWTLSNDSMYNYMAIWRPPQPGLYDVQVHVPRLNATTWGAHYWLVSTFNYMPSWLMVVDQKGIEDRWISLGIYEFGNGLSAPWYAVWLDDATLENPARDTHCGTDWCQIGVDAVRFRSVWPVYIPTVRKDPSPTYCPDC